MDNPQVKKQWLGHRECFTPVERALSMPFEILAVATRENANMGVIGTAFVNSKHESIFIAKLN